MPSNSQTNAREWTGQNRLNKKVFYHFAILLIIIEIIIFCSINSALQRTTHERCSASYRINLYTGHNKKVGTFKNLEKYKFYRNTFQIQAVRFKIINFFILSI